MPALCRDCLASFDDARPLPVLRRPRVLRHPELFSLSVAHMDCRRLLCLGRRNATTPTSATSPVIVGGGRRGVVTTACYIARNQGRSFRECRCSRP